MGIKNNRKRLAAAAIAIAGLASGAVAAHAARGWQLTLPPSGSV